MKHLIFLSLLFLLTACSTDRLYPLESDLVKISSTNTDSLFLALGPQMQKFEITSTTKMPIITKNGNELWIYRDNFNQLPAYPYTVEITELLTLRDMILAKRPTVSGNKLLTTDGAFFINVTKDGSSLSLNRYNPYTLIVNDNSIDTNMSLFVGDDNTGWVPVTDTSRLNERGNLTFEGKQYYVFPPTLGWINIDKFVGYEGETTSLKFTCTNAEINNLAIYLVFPSLNSVMQVNVNKDFPLPIGEKVKVVAITVDENKKIFSYFEDTTVEKDKTISITLKATTQKDLENELGKL